MNNAANIASDIFASTSSALIRAQRKGGSWDLTATEILEVEHILGRLPTRNEVAEIEAALTALL